MAHRLSKEELDEQFEQFLKESLSDDSFDSSKKSTILESIGKPKTQKPQKKTSSPWWLTGDDSDEGDGTLTNRSFLKSQRTSQPIEEEEEDDEKHAEMQDRVCESMDRDSLDVEDSVVASGPNPGLQGFGLDTLEEQEEKERFFAKLEKGASSTIDYSKLNKELDSTDSAQFTALICKNENPPHGQEQNKSESKDLSGNYSEDFEEDAESISNSIKSNEQGNKYSNEKTNLNNQVEENPGMLAKVLLLDSLDSTMDTQKLLQQTDPNCFTPQGTNDALGTGISNAYSNSDMEALHQAYRHLEQSVEESNENNYFVALEQASSSLGDTSHANEKKNLEKKSTVESDMPTLDELMQPIRVDYAGEHYPGGTPVSLPMPEDNKMVKETDSIATEKFTHAENQEEQSSDYLHQWKSESRNSFSTSEIELHYDSKKDLIAPEAHGHERFSKGSDYPDLHAYQEERNSHASGYPHKMMHNYVLDMPQKKQFNKDKPPTSVLKKPQNPHYANVKSSGYGKASTPLKQSRKLDLKDSHMATKEKSPSDGKQKGILSATRTIRFAETTSGASKTMKTDTSAQQQTERIPKRDFGEVDITPEYNDHNFHRSTYGILLRNEALSQSLNANDEALGVCARLLNVKQQLETEKLVADISKKEEELQQKTEQEREKYQKECSLLKQENYMLRAKLHAEEEKRKKKVHLIGEPGAPVTEEKLRCVQQEIEEQETILQGYQQENEKLYQQVKELQIRNKQNEEQMFQENLSLRTELATLREQINTNAIKKQCAHIGDDSKNSSNTELMNELRVLQKREHSLLDEITQQKQDKQALEFDLAQIRKERDLVKTQLAQTSGDKAYEMKIAEATYKEEISRLNKRLQWFAENQEMLDKDAGRLRDAYEQIETLTIQVEKLRHAAGNQFVQQQNRLKDRTADAKRIQDLERQVKEMEAIIKRRHPNSIPALIYAAATAPLVDNENSTKSKTVSFLERRIQKLEADLESKDEDSKKSLRTMEQQFQKIKIQYENRINELEGLLTERRINEPQNQFDNTTRLKALEQELCICKEAHQMAVMNYRKEIDNLKQENAFLERKAKIYGGNCASINNQLEEFSDKARMTILHQELNDKCMEIQELTKTVERLQRERMVMLSEKNTSDKIQSKKKCNSKAETDIAPSSKGRFTEINSFPGTLDEKLYQPGTFADIHISDIQQENDRLKAEVKRLTLEVNEQKTHFESSLSHAEHTILRLKKETAERTAALKQSHQREREKLICQHALEHSKSRAAELSNTIATQEVLIKHLQKQVNTLQKETEVLSLYRIREEALQKEMAKLIEDLRESKECHSPQMKQFLSLESKLKHMEIRYSQREEELQQIIKQTHHAASEEQAKEVEKWKKLSNQKNIELEKFRMELDAILDVLRVLQRQGVVIPTSTSDRTKAEVC
ncbi:centrosomal protein of 162 kDa isoform X1 [Pelobates fuscus]|uniref:centrosomal protein of 162 kDa isoform X1 n=1 Tax=Pelobates fuscus TaxID=191477 RepID=UPI002FE49B8D